MIVLVAVALANADGRAGLFLSHLLNARDDRRMVVAAVFGGFIVNAAVAAAAGSAANRMIGQGVVALLVALALLSAAAALLWPGRPYVAADADRVRAVSGPALAVRLFARQFGDRSHLMIAALAATSGAGLWAAAGGLIGWVLAMLPFLAFGAELAARRSMRLLRVFAAAILTIWGARVGLGAFGLIG